jgi:threonine dehydratase
MAADVDLGRIEEAARTSDPAFRDSPQFVSEQLCAALQRNVLVKLETANPLGSFKGRGAGFLVHSLPPGSSIVCASSGNFGVALAYAARPGHSRARLLPAWRCAGCVRSWTTWSWCPIPRCWTGCGWPPAPSVS